MTLFWTVITTIFAVLGVFAVLDGWAEKTKKPKKWIRINKERRSFLVLFASTIVGIFIGSFRWYERRKDKEILENLYDLEVLLAQLSGLVNSAIMQKEIKYTFEPIKSVADRIGKYGFKASRTLLNLQKLLPESDYLELKKGAMMITVGLEIIEVPEDKEDPTKNLINALINMQGGINRLQVKTRDLINERAEKN